MQVQKITHDHMKESLIAERKLTWKSLTVMWEPLWCGFWIDIHLTCGAAQMPLLHCNSINIAVCHTSLDVVQLALWPTLQGFLLIFHVC